jgi:Zn-dependent protease/predicted transcriptional regulator
METFMARKGFFGSQLTLFRLFGFTVRLDASWIFIALLVTWTLAAGLFPLRQPGLAPGLYWAMGVFGALGLFASIVFHEFWHSVVARRYGLPMKGITLFIFGGMAEMDDEPQRPGVEFAMAIAGPIASVVIGAFFYLLYSWGSDVWGVAATEVLWYLAFINWVLAAFNMVPAFPLDGGRLLRSALWRWKGDLRWATHKAARFGSGFGLVLIALGILSLLTGNLVGGFWYVILGLFLRSAAQMSYQQVLLRESFEDVPVRRLMKDQPITVSPDISLRELVEEHIYVHHFKMFPVVEKDRLLGCITTRAVKSIPREEWASRAVRSVMGSCADGHTVAPEMTVTEALSIMNKHELSRLMVVRDGHLEGIISLKDILGSLSARQELEP